MRNLDTIQLELLGDEARNSDIALHDFIVADAANDQAIESYDNTQDNIRKFEIRLNLPLDANIDENALSESDMPKSKRVPVKVLAASTFGRSTTSTVASDIDTNHIHIENKKWLETMNNFREETYPAWREAEKQARKNPSEDWLANLIVVALIDDGVDVLEPSL